MIEYGYQNYQTIQDKNLSSQHVTRIDMRTSRRPDTQAAVDASTLTTAFLPQLVTQKGANHVCSARHNASPTIEQNTGQPSPFSCLSI